MDQDALSEILARILVSDERWHQEVERNQLLQETIEDLFVDPVFQRLLERGVLPRHIEQPIPHYRAIELICALRELIRQVAEGNAGYSVVERGLEDFMFRVSIQWQSADRLEATLTTEAALAEAERVAGIYEQDRKFSARLDKFRLLVVPLAITPAGGAARYQLVILENIRPPRSQWRKK